MHQLDTGTVRIASLVVQSIFRDMWSAANSCKQAAAALSGSISPYQARWYKSTMAAAELSPGLLPEHLPCVKPPTIGRVQY